MVLKLLSRKPSEVQATGQRSAAPSPAGKGQDYRPAEKTTCAEDPLERALQRGRFGIILTRGNGWADHPKFNATRAAATEAIDERFGIVPEGYASVPLTITDEPGCPEEDHETEPFLAARHTLTNAEFQMFVDDGGYQDLELWPQDIWPHLIGFKDLTDGN